MQGLSRRRPRRKIPGSISILFLVSILGYARVVKGFLPSSAKISRPSGPWEILAEGRSKSDDGYDGLGEYDPSENLRPEREVVVGNPQLRVKEKDRSVTSILRELAAIQQQGPQKYCILGTRHCSYLHQQIIELLYVLIDVACQTLVDPMYHLNTMSHLTSSLRLFLFSSFLQSLCFGTKWKPCLHFGGRWY